MERLLRIYRKEERLVAGLMSGTSLDGIDVALTRIRGCGAKSEIELIAFKTIPFTFEIRQELLAVCAKQSSDVELVCRLNFTLGELFAAAVKEICQESGIALADLDIVGSHGQTIQHLPGDSTLQIGEPAVIAERTGVVTVADFRVRDVAAGGQGAPLVPYTEYLLFRHATKNRLLQNIGGIANVTLLPASATPEDVMAFDTGPGNMMLDACMEIITGGSEHFDRDGQLAAAGTIHTGLLQELQGHPYFMAPPPKTTGREAFGTEYTAGVVKKGLANGVSAADMMATFTAFTAASIADSYRRFIFPRCRVDEVIVSGGGRLNRTLLTMLRQELPGVRVLTAEDIGFCGDAKEAVAFAILANEAISGQTNNLPAVTGARRPVIMGKILL
ncbi:MAG: anhydro-N-acetylmuramic acid kinase [Negativicutes bacterium]|nr:anhydro-N-acetylmuramic acid kinase [Negativicutes bacterium]